jgi:hypothetical protein
MPRTTQDREISSFGGGTAGSVTPYRCVHSCTGALETLKPRQLRCSVSVRFCCWGRGKFGMVGVAVGSFGKRSSQSLKVTYSYTKVLCISKTPTAHVIEC